MKQPLLPVCFGIVTVALVSSCGNRDSFDVRLGYYGPKTHHKSPFSERKMLVGLSEGESLVKNSKRLVATIDNHCSDKACKEEKTSGVNLSCFLTQGQSSSRNPALKVQAYDFILSKQMSLADLKEQIEEDKCVVGVSEDRKYQAVSSWSPNDTYYSQQKAYLDTVKWAAGMMRRKDATPFNELPLKKVKVAIIDSGVGTHPDLEGVVIERLDLRSLQSKAQTTNCPTELSNLENPQNAHGTFVAGILGAQSNNEMGLTGIAKNTEIISIMIGNCKGEMSTAEVANAMGAAFSRGAEIINLSLGGATDPDPAFEFTLTQILNKKTVVVVSAGNAYKNLQTGDGLPKSYPASYAPNYPGVIAVAWGKQDGTLQKGDEVTWGSNYGKDVVKLLAPGENVVSTMNPSGAQGYQLLATDYGKGSGSSFSAPMVTGAVAVTIGFLKQNNLDFDERMVEDIILKTCTTKPDLEDFVQKGRLLDFDKLVDTLLKLSTSGLELPMNISSTKMSYNTSTKSSEIEFNLSWDVPFPHYGARLGIFDLSQGCNFSAPCLVQDFELGATKGSRRIKLSRNETLPLVSSLNDPNFDLNLVSAIYYQQPDPKKPGMYKNVFGIDSKKNLNIRDFDGSRPQSPLIGEVIQMRTDQDRIFISGWVCLQDSNKALKVELLDEYNNQLIFDTAYEWKYMMSSRIRGRCLETLDDGGGEGCHRSANGDVGSFPFAAGKIHQKSLKSVPAGLESTPLLMVDNPPDSKRAGCHTMTTNHGFEFILPFEHIWEKKLMGKKLKVKAHHPTQKKYLIIPDQFGNSEITIPEINYHKAGSEKPERVLQSSISLKRNKDTIQIEGDLCSRSPSPITAEITYSHWGIKCRLNNEEDFPLRTLSEKNSCALIRNGWPLVHDPELKDIEDNVSIYPDSSELGPSDAKAVFLKFKWRQNVSQEIAKLWENFIATFEPFYPNAFIGGPYGNFATYREDIKKRELIDIASQKKIVDIVRDRKTFSELGLGQTELARIHQTRRSSSGFRSSSFSVLGNLNTRWDRYDNGEGYTPAVVAYNFEPTSETGRFLKEELRVSKVMRETKKYETPLPHGYVFLGETQLKEFQVTESCFKFPVNHEITGLSKLKPALSGTFAKILFDGDKPPEFTFKIDIEKAMQSLPIEIRFFQDGVLIEHLLSNFREKTFRNTHFTTYEE